MKTTGNIRRRIGVIAASAAVLVTGGAALSLAATSAPPSNGTSTGHGINEYGSTVGFYKGTTVRFNYSHGFYCDTSVSSAASTGCEAGASWKKAPSKQHDPLFVTVPLGFSVPRAHVDCPANLVCVDHGGTIDLSRLEPALKPLFPSLTDAQLTNALKNYALPEHDPFLTDLNNRQPEWWDVRVIGVLSPKTMAAIRAHGSYGYIASLIKKGDKTVVGPIPTNEFLYFRAF